MKILPARGSSKPISFHTCCGAFSKRNAMRHSDIINGLPVGKSVVKIGMYADDTFLILNGLERSIKESLYVLDLFYKCSGLRTNMQKTQAVWVGDMKGKMKLQKS